jgi:hypothetical protein
MKKIISLLAVVICCSCNTEIESLEVQEMELIRTIYDLNDSIFFGRILDIEFQDDKYFLSDQGSNQVIVVDEDFNFLHRIGVSGPGPEEIKGISNIEVSKDKIVIQDLVGSKFLIYNLEGILKGREKVYFDGSEFILTDTSIIGMKVGETELPLLNYSFEGGQSVSFGLPLNSEFGFPAKHLIAIDSLIVSITNENTPVVDIYDKSGALLGATDLSSHYLIEPWLKDLGIKEKVQASTSSIKYGQRMFSDISNYREIIYLNMPPLGTKDSPKKKYIFEASIDRDFNFILTRALIFDTVFSFRCFAISSNGKSIVGYDPIKGGIVEYRIKSN